MFLFHFIFDTKTKANSEVSIKVFSVFYFQKHVPNLITFPLIDPHINDPGKFSIQRSQRLLTEIDKKNWSRFPIVDYWKPIRLLNRYWNGKQSLPCVRFRSGYWEACCPTPPESSKKRGLVWPGLFVIDRTLSWELTRC